MWFNNPWFVAEEYTRPYSEPELIASASLDYDITDDLNFLVKAATEREMNENDAKEVKKPDLCRRGIDFMCIAVWRDRYDCTGGKGKNIQWLYL